MALYRTPGVYFEWLDAQPAILARRTDIAGFVGIASRGPLHGPTKVTSTTQYETIFGPHIPQAFLSYAVEGFFANGGVECWVVRAANPDTAAPATPPVEVPERNLRFWLEAISPGKWGRKIKITTTPVGSGRIFLLLELPTGEREVWQNVSLDPGEPRYIETILNNPVAGSQLVRVRTGGTPHARATPGSEGLAGLMPEHLTGEGAPGWGLATLEIIDEVAIVAIPDIMPVDRRIRIQRPPSPRCHVLEEEPRAQPPEEKEPEFPPRFSDVDIDRMQRAMIGHCEKLRDRFAILDPAPTDRTPELILAKRKFFSSTYAALYYPWLKVPDPLGGSGLLRAIPPSGHVAGVYARVDRRTGVHKAPANEALEGVDDLTLPADDIIHGLLNESSVNLIRSYNGRGIRVFGARTLASPDDRRWVYINVRRLVMMIAEAIDESTQWVVFEPNNPELWSVIDRVCRGFLDGLWQRGMLDGATAAEAFTVRCDATTNPPEETAIGRAICEVGLQPPWPAEFVIVRIGKTASGVEILNAMEAQNG